MSEVHQAIYRDALAGAEKVKKMSDKDRWVNTLDQQMQANGLQVFPRGVLPKTVGTNIVVSEHRFDSERMWRFDRAIPFLKIAIEFEGGGFARPVTCNNCHRPVMRTLQGGRTVPVREGGYHHTGKGVENDQEKFNAAAMQEWLVLRFSPKHIKDGYAVACIIGAIRERSKKNPSPLSS